jgi:anti-anti-sigma factor
VIATLIVLAPLFSDLPKAVLAAVIIDAVLFGMIDIPEFRRLHRVTRFDFWIAVAAVMGVLSAGVLAGVVIGIALSLAWLIYVATQPSMPILGREPGTQVFRDVEENPDDETFEGIVVLRLDGGLFFATSEALENRIRALVDESTRALVLDLEGVDFVDSQGVAKITEIYEFLQADEIGFRLARVKPNVRAVLEADGAIARIGSDRVHGNVHRAVQAELDG